MDVVEDKVELVKGHTHLLMLQVQSVKVWQEELELKEVTKLEPEEELLVTDQMDMVQEELD
jgi:hypothetical protein